jgi:SWI/SNF-related matrix-associated actin-dependent regulator 1 of chromatin subfamily A
MAAVGGKKGRKRKAEVRRFQKDKSCRIFLGRLRADKESITLTAADTVLFIEMGWTPGEHDQAEDRVLRFGQLASNVYCYYMIARGTVDEYVWDLVEKKREVVGKILDGKERKRELNKRISARQLCKNLDKGKEPKCRHRRKRN